MGAGDRRKEEFTSCLASTAALNKLFEGVALTPLELRKPRLSSRKDTVELEVRIGEIDGKMMGMCAQFPYLRNLTLRSSRVRRVASEVLGTRG